MLTVSSPRRLALALFLSNLNPPFTLILLGPPTFHVVLRTRHNFLDHLDAESNSRNPNPPGTSPHRKRETRPRTPAEELEKCEPEESFMDHISHSATARTQYAVAARRSGSLCKRKRSCR